MAMVRSAVPVATSRRLLLSWTARIAGAVGALAAACGGPGTTQPAAGPSATPVKVSLMIKQRSSPAAEDILRKLFADHDQQEPAVQVDIELVESSDVLPKLTARAASGQAQA